MQKIFRRVTRFMIGFILFSSVLLAEDTRILAFGDNLNFGNVTVGESATRTLTLYNRGNSNLTVANLRFHENLEGVYSGNFSGIIPPNGEQNVTITFTPNAGQVYQGLVYVETDKTNSQDRTRVLLGMGIDEEGSVESRILEFGDNLNFGDVTLGSSSVKELILYNRGNAPLHIDQIRFHSRLQGAFSGSFSGDIPAGGEQRVSISFSPTSEIIYQGLVYVESNRTNSGDRTRLLTGHGIAGSGGSDTVKPTITLIGGDVTLTLGDAYSDEGATASDDRDGDITADINVTSTVNSAVAGVYTVRYNVNDSAGNSADEVVRSVTVIDPVGGFKDTLVNKCGISLGEFQSNFDTSTGIYNGNISCEKRGLTDSDILTFNLLTEVMGNLLLNENNFTNLDGLNSLVKVEESLALGENRLVSIDGLNALVEAGSIIINEVPTLSNIDGLSNLQTIHKDLWFYNVALLENIDGLNSLESVGRSLGIFGTNINNLDALSNLTSLPATDGGLALIQNPNLTDISGLNNLHGIDGQKLYIDLNQYVVKADHDSAFCQVDWNIGTASSDIDDNKSLICEGEWNRAPVAVEDNISTSMNQMVTIDVLANDSDADGDTLSIANITTPGSGGMATLNGSMIDYTPAPNFIGVDTFIYTVNDGTLDGNSVSVVVTVTPDPVVDSCDHATAITREDLITKIINAEDVTSVNTCMITDMSNLLNNSYLGYIYHLTEAQKEVIRDFDQDISGWDTSKVLNMSSMFNDAHLFNQDISDWNTSSVTNMSFMFYKASSFDQPIGDWNISLVNNIKYMFREATNFNQDISQWDISSLTDMDGLFYDASSFNQDISQWDVSHITNMNSMFYGTSSFNQPLEVWDVSAVTSMRTMFYKSHFNQPLNDWNISNVTNLSSMFCYASDFNQPLDKWDVSNVTDMSTLFFFTAFNQPIGNWNMSKVTNIDNMFGFTPFDQDIGLWDVSKVTRMGGVFGHTPFNQDISRWDVSSAEYMGSLFRSTPFNQDISDWNLSSATYIGEMFYEATEFNQDIGDWNVSNVTSLYGLFRGATSFNQDISRWDVSNVEMMWGTFWEASAFSNQDLSSWDVSSVTDHSYFSYRWGENNIEPAW